jgi:hypothetical protein
LFSAILESENKLVVSEEQTTMPIQFQQLNTVCIGTFCCVLRIPLKLWPTSWSDDWVEKIHENGYGRLELVKENNNDYIAVSGSGYTV